MARGYIHEQYDSWHKLIMERRAREKEAVRLGGRTEKAHDFHEQAQRARADQVAASGTVTVSPEVAGGIPDRKKRIERSGTAYAETKQKQKEKRARRRDDVSPEQGYIYSYEDEQGVRRFTENPAEAGDREVTKYTRGSTRRKLAAAGQAQEALDAQRTPEIIEPEIAEAGYIDTTGHIDPYLKTGETSEGAIADKLAKSAKHATGARQPDAPLSIAIAHGATERGKQIQETTAAAMIDREASFNKPEVKPIFDNMLARVRKETGVSVGIFPEEGEEPKYITDSDLVDSDFDIIMQEEFDRLDNLPDYVVPQSVKDDFYARVVAPSRDAAYSIPTMTGDNGEQLPRSNLVLELEDGMEVAGDGILVAGPEHMAPEEEGPRINKASIVPGLEAIPGLQLGRLPDWWGHLGKFDKVMTVLTLGGVAARDARISLDAILNNPKPEWKGTVELEMARKLLRLPWRKGIEDLAFEDFKIMEAHATEGLNDSIIGDIFLEAREHFYSGKATKNYEQMPLGQALAFDMTTDPTVLYSPIGHGAAAVFKRFGPPIFAKMAATRLATFGARKLGVITTPGAKIMNRLKSASSSFIHSYKWQTVKNFAEELVGDVHKYMQVAHIASPPGEAGLRYRTTRIVGVGEVEKKIPYKFMSDKLENEIAPRFNGVRGIWYSRKKQARGWAKALDKKDMLSDTPQDWRVVTDLLNLAYLEDISPGVKEVRRLIKANGEIDWDVFDKFYRSVDKRHGGKMLMKELVHGAVDVDDADELYNATRTFFQRRLRDNPEIIQTYNLIKHELDRLPELAAARGDLRYEKMVSYFPLLRPDHIDDLSRPIKKAAPNEFAEFWRKRRWAGELPTSSEEFEEILGRRIAGEHANVQIREIEGVVEEIWAKVNEDLFNDGISKSVMQGKKHLARKFYRKVGKVQVGDIKQVIDPLTGEISENIVPHISHWLPRTLEYMTTKFKNGVLAWNPMFYLGQLIADNPGRIISAWSNELHSGRVVNPLYWIAPERRARKMGFSMEQLFPDQGFWPSSHMGSSAIKAEWTKAMSAPVGQRYKELYKFVFGEEFKAKIWKPTVETAETSRDIYKGVIPAIRDKLFDFQAMTEEGFKKSHALSIAIAEQKRLAKLGIKVTDMEQLVETLGKKKADDLFFDYSKRWHYGFQDYVDSGALSPFLTFAINKNKYFIKDFVRNPWKARALKQMTDRWNSENGPDTPEGRALQRFLFAIGMPYAYMVPTIVSPHQFTGLQVVDAFVGRGEPGWLKEQSANFEAHFKEQTQGLNTQQVHKFIEEQPQGYKQWYIDQQNKEIKSVLDFVHDMVTIHPGMRMLAETLNISRPQFHTYGQVAPYMHGVNAIMEGMDVHPIKFIEEQTGFDMSIQTPQGKLAGFITNEQYRDGIQAKIETRLGRIRQAELRNQGRILESNQVFTDPREAARIKRQANKWMAYSEALNFFGFYTRFFDSNYIAEGSLSKMMGYERPNDLAAAKAILESRDPEVVFEANKVGDAITSDMGGDIRIEINPDNEPVWVPGSQRHFAAHPDWKGEVETFIGKTGGPTHERMADITSELLAEYATMILAGKTVEEVNDSFDTKLLAEEYGAGYVLHIGARSNDYAERITLDEKLPPTAVAIAEQFCSSIEFIIEHKGGKAALQHLAMLNALKDFSGADKKKIYQQKQVGYIRKKAAGVVSKLKAQVRHEELKAIREDVLGRKLKNEEAIERAFNERVRPFLSTEESGIVFGEQSYKDKLDATLSLLSKAVSDESKEFRKRMSELKDEGLSEKDFNALVADVEIFNKSHEGEEVDTGSLRSEFLGYHYAFIKSGNLADKATMRLFRSMMDKHKDELSPLRIAELERQYVNQVVRPLMEDTDYKAFAMLSAGDKEIVMRRQPWMESKADSLREEEEREKVMPFFSELIAKKFSNEVWDKISPGDQKVIKKHWPNIEASVTQRALEDKAASWTTKIVESGFDIELVMTIPEEIRTWLKESSPGMGQYIERGEVAAGMGKDADDFVKKASRLTFGGRRGGVGYTTVTRSPNRYFKDFRNKNKNLMRQYRRNQTKYEPSLIMALEQYIQRLLRKTYRR